MAREDTMKLTHGSHADTDGQCLMEAVALLGGEEKTDDPACACPVLSAYGRRLNDAMGKGAEGDALRAKYLADLAPRLVGTRSTPEVEQRRAYVLADHAVRAFAPMALDAAGLVGEAEKLRALDPIRDRDTATHAIHAAYAAYAADGAAAAAHAAWAAAHAAGAATHAIHAAYAAADTSRAAADAEGWEEARTALIAALEVQHQPEETP